MKKLPLVTILVLSLAVLTAASTKSETIEVSSIPDSCYMGDLDLDGISTSIADLALFTSYFRCGIIIFVHDLEWQIEQTDFNCDGLVLSVADLVTAMRVLDGEIEPCYCLAGSTIVLTDPTPARTSAEPYTISIVDQPGSGFGRDTVNIMISGVSELVGYQLHLEYDTAGIVLAEVLQTELFSDWQVFAYTETINGLTAQLKIISTSNPSILPSLQPPSEPTAMARLVFDVTSGVDLVRDIRFVWDDCGDNGIAVLDTGSSCQYPDYLAISRDIYDADGGIITGSSAPYGGAGDICMAGFQFGEGTLPVRAIDFQSGRLEYSTACCVGIRGDVDGDGSDGDIADLTCFVIYFFGPGCPISCFEEADFNADGSIDISDLTLLIAYMFRGGQPPFPCN